VCVCVCDDNEWMRRDNALVLERRCVRASQKNDVELSNKERYLGVVG